MTYPAIMLVAGEASAALHGAVFPFELPFYRRARVPVEYVGHPLVDALATVPARGEARARLGIGADEHVIGLLPGSRHGEVERLLPIMRDAIAHIAARRPSSRFVLALAPTVSAALVSRYLDGAPVTVVRDDVHDVIRASDVVLATSGTVTLEAA